MELVAVKRYRRLVTTGTAFAFLMTLIGAPALALPSQAACQVQWGSLPKRVVIPVSDLGEVTNVRSGRHDCYDRVVVDISRGTSFGYNVRYVDSVGTPGQGENVPLRGGAKLQFIANAPAYNDLGQATYSPANWRELVNVSGYQTLRQVAMAGSFEGETTFGVGVRAQLPFRVSVVDGAGPSSRVVLDVAHQW
jgi:hypothetical protein